MRSDCEVGGSGMGFGRTDSVRDVAIGKWVLGCDHVDRIKDSEREAILFLLQHAGFKSRSRFQIVRCGRCPFFLGMDPQVFLFIGFLILVGTIAYIGHLQAKKRREAFQRIANQLGFRFASQKDRHLARQYGFLDHMDDGSNRYAFNVLSGADASGASVCIFDYHYETHSRDSKGRRRTHHHYRSIFTLILPSEFPELNIEPEGFFSKIGQALGFDDIDFESMEFSKRYAVKSREKKFAYDFCNAQMIDFLLRQRDLIIEVDGNVLALTFKGKLAIDAILPNYERLKKIRSLMPNYLFN